jgi:hypothetical protein
MERLADSEDPLPVRVGQLVLFKMCEAGIWYPPWGWTHNEGTTDGGW